MNKRIKAGCLILSMLIILTACSSGLTGGQNKSALDPKNPVSITLWHYYVGANKIALETAVEQFNKSVGLDKGVIVNVVAKGSIAELEKAVTDSAKGVINCDPMPDLFSSYPDKALEIDQLGKICDLNDYFSEDDQKMYVEEFLNDGKFDGNRLLSVPIVKSTELLYINDTAWNDFSAATGFNSEELTTWEGIYQVAKAYYQWTDAQTPETSWDGKSFMGIDSVGNFVIIANKQLGVEIIDGDNEQTVLNHEVLKKIFNFYYGGMSLGYLNAVGKFRSDDIKAGDLVAYVGSSSGAAYFPTWIEKNNTQSSIDFLALAYPVFESGTLTAIQQGAGMSVAKSTPENQEGAVLFLKWFTAQEQNIPFAMTTGYLPVETDAYTNTEFNTSLESLRTGDSTEKNVATVYDIALNQIMKSNTYASKPFKGSYNVRTILEKSLTEMAKSGSQQAAILKEQGMSEQEILENLNMNARFDEWLSSIRTQLKSLEISYIEE